MAKIIYAHPTVKGYAHHIFTDLDFWDARKILRDLFDYLSVRRNFGNNPPGDEFPTQIVFEKTSKIVLAKVEARLKKAIPSPPRHVVVRHMILNGFFSFNPSDYYPNRWSKEKIEHFTWCRLPLEQTALCSPYQTVVLEWCGELLVVKRTQRSEKYDPKITTYKEERRWRFIPSAF
ncbi:MAG: hypothetical protein WHS38_10785 [Thermodesulforhabdaceae bacterium]